MFHHPSKGTIVTIVVTGATGHLGQLTVQALLDRGVAANDIVAGGRNDRRPPGTRRAGVRTANIDYNDPASLAAAFVGADKVLLISGTARASESPSTAR